MHKGGADRQIDLIADQREIRDQPKIAALDLRGTFKADIERAAKQAFTGAGKARRNGYRLGDAIEC